MQRTYTFISAVLLLAFVGLLVLNLSPDQFKSAETASVEEVDLHDWQDDETEELELNLKEFVQQYSNQPCTSELLKNEFYYHFTIKSFSRKVNFLPPER